MHKIWQSGEFLGRHLRTLIKTELPLIGNVLKPLARSVLVLLGLTAAVSATDIHQKMFGSGTITFTISNEEINDIMKRVKSLEESELLIKISEIIKNKAKEQKGGLLSMLLGTIGVSFLGNLIARKSTIRAGEGTSRVGEWVKEQLEQVKIFNAPHHLTNFEIQKYHQNEPKFNGVNSRNNLAKIKDGTYVINLDEYESFGTYWIAVYVNDNNIIYFDNFGVEHLPKEIKKFIANKNIIKNIYRIQAYDSIMCGYFCIVIIGFMLTSKNLLDFTNLFSPNDYEKNDKIILIFFQ